MPPPPSSPPPNSDALSSLLRHLDFFLDLGADTTFPAHLSAQYSYRRAPTPHSQFIHRGGTVLAVVLPAADCPGARAGEGGQEGPAIAFVPNRVCTNHRPDLDAKGPVERLVELCRDEEALRRVYDEAIEAAAL